MYNNNGTNLTLTVNREKLVAELETKRAELEAAYDEQIKEFADKIDGLASSGEAWGDYHATIAEGLREGHFTYGENGRISTTDKRHYPLPEKPTSKTGHGNRADLERRKQHAEHYKERALKPVDAALRLLKLSDSVTVDIDSANYNGLLSQTAEDVRGYYY